MMFDKTPWIAPGQIRPYSEVIMRLKESKTVADYNDVLVFAYGSSSKRDEAEFVVLAWRIIPDDLIYHAWTSAVSDDRGYYNKLFNDEIIEKLRTV
jgi:hypothetical protein